eukprot:523285_1
MGYEMEGNNELDEEEEEEEIDEEENLEEDVIDMAALPTDMKGWRACMSCALIKTFSQFADRGCDNCPFLSVEEGLERVHECTSQHFSGVIALIEPQTSWVARWQVFFRLFSFRCNFRNICAYLNVCACFKLFGHVS